MTILTLFSLNSVTDPSGVRFSVTGDVLQLKAPRSTWDKYFHDVIAVCTQRPRPRYYTQGIQSSPLSPVPLTHSTLSPIGRNPVKKVNNFELTFYEFL